MGKTTLARNLAQQAVLAGRFDQIDMHPRLMLSVAIPGTSMVRPAMQEDNRCLVEGNVAANYPASSRGIITEVDPRAPMEFASLAVLNQYITRQQ